MLADRIKATETNNKISDLVIQPENSRAVPDLETISVYCGVCCLKHLLQKAKQNVEKPSEEQYPDCLFSVSTIMRISLECHFNE